LHSRNEPFVTVLTPVYNTEQYIAECIESVLAQTYTNWEYVIVNNCSTDRTLEIAQSYAAKDKRIRVHNNAEFLGIIANHNLAFNLMSPDAKYCKLVSADDWLFPDCIRQMVELGEAHPTVGIIATYQISTEKINNLGMPYPESFVSGKEIARRSLLGGPYVFGAPTSLIYRSDLVRSVKEFYPGTSPHADTAACYEYLDRCDFGFVHQILTYERWHAGQASERARIMNCYVPDNLLYLVEYGRKYLTEEEFQNRLRQRLKNYYNFLAKSWLQGRDKEFWEYHKLQLTAAGCPLNRLVLVRAVLDFALNKVLNPKQTIENLFVRAY
jgi:glycosyltransferase involved in cell wall biosynthesis